MKSVVYFRAARSVAGEDARAPSNHRHEVGGVPGFRKEQLSLSAAQDLRLEISRSQDSKWSNIPLSAAQSASDSVGGVDQFGGLSWGKLFM